jgi:hypothetical protein
MKKADNVSQPRASIDHQLSGILQQMQQCRRKGADLRRAIEDIDQQIAAVLAEYRKLADIHEVWDRDLPGHEAFTRRHEGQWDKARHYRLAAFCATALAIVFGIYFSFQTLNAQSPFLLFVGCTIVALTIGVIGAACLRAMLGAHPENPRAIKKVNVATGIIGVSLFILVAAFAWIRFKVNSPISTLLPFFIIGLEFSAILLAGAFDCGYRIYRWSAVYDRKFHSLSNRKRHLEDQLAENAVRLQELEYRLDQIRDTPVETRMEV